jgi:inhibitor of Bruton tyrosine kinase
LHFAPYPTENRIPSPSYSPIDDSSHDTDSSVQDDIGNICFFCELLSADHETRKVTECDIFDNARFNHGSDLLVQAQTGISIPVHRIILSCRCPLLARVLSGATKVVQDREANIVIKANQGRSLTANHPMPILAITGCQPLSILILLTYFYSDQVPALWDPRVWSVVGKTVRSITKVDATKIKLELLTLARVLDLTFLAQTIEVSVKKIPTPSMILDFKRAFDETQVHQNSLLCKPDVVLDLADRQVFCHSVLLRARSPLFAAFFNDKYWTVNRWRTDGTILVDLKHLRWRAMQFVVRFLCCGEDEEMFRDIGASCNIHIDCLQMPSITAFTSTDELLDLMLDVIAASVSIFSMDT